MLADMSAFCKDHSNLKFYDLRDVPALEKQALVEKHLISPEHSKDDQQCRGLAVNEDGSTSIMINEEDHLRIQCFAPGLNLQELWKKANMLDGQCPVSTPNLVGQQQAVVLFQEIAGIAFFFDNLLRHRLQIGQNILLALTDGALIGG